MVFGNTEYDPSEQSRLAAPDTHHAEMHTDNAVRAVVEQEFSFMDLEHARIRAEALAARIQDDRTKT